MEVLKKLKKYTINLTPGEKLNFMNINFQSLNYKADQKLIQFAEKRIDKLSQFYHQIIHVFIFTKVENNSNKINKLVELKIGVPGDEVIVKKKAKTFEVGINLVAETAERILKKLKQKKNVVN